MELNKLVFGGLIVGCLAAAGGGAYLATRHNAEQSQGAAQASPAPAPASEALPAGQPVTASEGVLTPEPAPAPTPAVAAAPAPARQARAAAPRPPAPARAPAPRRDAPAPRTNTGRAASRPCRRHHPQSSAVDVGAPGGQASAGGPSTGRRRPGRDDGSSSRTR
jgi:hypothetical protein